MSTHLLQAFYSSFESRLKDPKNQKEMERFFGDYINRNISKLSTLGPTYRTMYTETDRSHLYGVLETDPKSLLEVIKKVPNVKSQQIILKEPYFTLVTLCTRVALVTKNDKLLNVFQGLIALSMMPGLHFKYFKHEPNPDIMDYTMNNLSYKFIARKEGTFWNAIASVVSNAMKLHKERLLQGSDDRIFAYVLDIKTRLNGLYKSLAREFYKNVEKGIYLSKEGDNFSEDNYAVYDSNSYAVERITNKVVSELVIHGPSMKIVSVSAKINQVSVSELRNYMTTMITNDHREDIRLVVENILTIYLLEKNKRPEDINNSQFVVDCFDIYRTSNLQDKRIAQIKEILEKWMRELGTYDKTNNKGTLNNFRRAFFTFFVYSIQTIHLA